ncbi:zinc finger protein 675-like [Rhagoletis pomonella]|uniref:zinc finger protein 675-like n=1 Tax=Rhagoletis pomonella TaxID=28610 RepID=UPI00177BCEF1|nr:zinc finger protein 675-like [Rhagoletis pomonella]
MVKTKLELDAPTIVCRICLQSGETGEEMASIFDKDADSVYLYKKIERCGGIKILTEPKLPANICKKCNAFLIIAHKFRIICKNSDNYLRKFVCKSSKPNKNEENQPEYIQEYSKKKPVKTEVLNAKAPTVNESQHDINYEEVVIYSEEFMLDEGVDDDLIIEDYGDSSQESQDQLQPMSTFGTPEKGNCEKITEQNKIKKEKQIHICEICGNIYPRNYELQVHMRRHRNERIYECEICGNSFHLNSELTRHIRTHTGERPYACRYCERTFSSRSSRIDHERVHRNERPYNCDICGKNFSYSSVLKSHKLTHTGEKLFSCGICGKRFTRGHHLRAHLETLQHQNDPRSKELIKQIKRQELSNV